MTTSTADGRISGPRTLAELKAETQRRADGNLAPLTGVRPEDARAALERIHTLERDVWAEAWSAVAQVYVERARTLEASAPDEARGNYLRAWHNFNVGRWPTENSPAKRTARAAALDAFARHARLLAPPIDIVRIAFDGGEIVGYLRLPEGERPAPLVLGIAGLDSRKEDVAAASDRYLEHGIGIFAFDMPGTGEAPIKAEVGAERMFSAILDFVATRPEIDARRVVVQGRSWSGYWAALLAYTERQRLRGAVVHGGPIHGYFQRAWQENGLSTPEYLFDLFEARAAIYPGITTREELYAFLPRMSLMARGLLDEPSAPMLIVNGALDTQVPIDDLFLLLRTGSPKEAWVNPAGGHMGRSANFTSPMIARQVVIPWIARALRGEVPAAR